MISHSYCQSRGALTVLLRQLQTQEHGKNSLKRTKGDGNDGEPDALEKFEMEKRPKIGWN